MFLAIIQTPVFIQEGIVSVITDTNDLNMIEKIKYYNPIALIEGVYEVDDSIKDKLQFINQHLSTQWDKELEDSIEYIEYIKNEIEPYIINNNDEVRYIQDNQ